MGVAAQERNGLCDLLLELGPDAPTLIGWTTGELAVHLLVRERRPDAAAGLVVPPLSSWTKRVEAKTASSLAFPEVVARVRSAPRAWPSRLPGVDDVLNTLEFFVHHEDVLRARPGWSPRQLPAAEEKALRRGFRWLGPILLRRLENPVRLVLPEDRTFAWHPAKDAGAPEVTVTGPLPELLLWCYGRRTVARVTVEGPDEAVARVAATDLGL